MRMQWLGVPCRTVILSASEESPQQKVEALGGVVRRSKE